MPQTHTEFPGVPAVILPYNQHSPSSGANGVSGISDPMMLMVPEMDGGAAMGGRRILEHLVLVASVSRSRLGAEQKGHWTKGRGTSLPSLTPPSPLSEKEV